jgi:hypothetical protein
MLGFSEFLDYIAQEQRSENWICFRPQGRGRWGW